MKIECSSTIEYSVVVDSEGGDLSEERIDNILKQQNTKIIKGIMIDYVEVESDSNESIRLKKNSNAKDLSNYK